MRGPRAIDRPCWHLGGQRRRKREPLAGAETLDGRPAAGRRREGGVCDGREHQRGAGAQGASASRWSSSSTSGRAIRSRSGQAIAGAIGDEKLALQMKSLDAQIDALQAQY